MYTQNEMNAVLEEAAQKLGITLEGLKLAVWQQEEADGLRSDIKQYLDEEGLTYTEEDIDLIFDKVNTDRGEDTRMRIEVAFQQSGIRDSIEKSEIDAGFMPGTYFAADHEFPKIGWPLTISSFENDKIAGYVQMSGEDVYFHYDVADECLRINAEFEDPEMESDVYFEVRDAIEEKCGIEYDEKGFHYIPVVSDLEIDDQWVGGVINFQGSTFAFDYNTKTDAIFHKDEFSEELQEYLEEDFSPVTEAVNQYLFDIGFWRPAVSEIHMNQDGTFTGILVFANTTMDFTYDPEEDVHSIPGIPEDLMDVMLDEEANIHTEIAAAAEELMEKPRSSLDNLIAEAGEPAVNTNTESRNKEADAR